MDIEIPTGQTFRSELTVDNQHTALAYGSGLVNVFATPALVALMENAAYKCIEPFLPQGFSSVGTEVSIKHLKATLPNKKVYAVSKVLSVSGRRVLFEVEAFDADGLIGSGEHERCVVYNEHFMNSLKD